MTSLKSLNPKVLGQRLTDARKARGITQEAAAAHLKCSRPTLIAIEKGTRLARAEEIIALASLYGRKVHELVQPGEPHGDLQPHLRAVAQKGDANDAEVAQVISALQRFADDYCRLERLLNLPMATNYPTAVSLALGPKVDVAAFAEDQSIQERQRLGLGDDPIIHLRSLLEFEVGVRILYDDLPSRIAGMFAYSSHCGGVVVVNRKHPPQRRRATLAHEYGHLIVDRFEPGIDYVADSGKKPANERFAESFAMAFLMPGTSVRRRFHQIVNDRGDFQVADLVRLAHYFFVSVEALAIRLENLGLVPKGVRDLLKESKFQVGPAHDLLSLPPHPSEESRFSDRYVHLAVQAFDRAELSEGELASILRCDRVRARELVEQYTTTNDDVSDSGESKAFRFGSYSDQSLLNLHG